MCDPNRPVILYWEHGPTGRLVDAATCPGPGWYEVRNKHCQNGGEICLAGNADGVCCPDDSCDIDDGLRHVQPPLEIVLSNLNAEMSRVDALFDTPLTALGLQQNAARMAELEKACAEIKVRIEERDLRASIAGGPLAPCVRPQL